MNAGAARASGDWLCFLHADCRLTHPNQLADAIAALARWRDPRIAGHFALRFVDTGARHRFFYRYLEAKCASGRRYTINGDQGLLLRRGFFDGLGGFDTGQPFLEDQRMAAAVARFGRWALCPHRLASSARRFESEGAAPRYLLMALIMAMHIVGVSLFFARAPCVYRRQTDTRRLQLSPYIGLLAALWRECGFKQGLGVAWCIAGVSLRESWQLFFALDVLCRQHSPGARKPFTRLHDRVLAPLLHNRVAQAFWLVWLVGTVFGPLRLWCRLREK